MTFPLPCAHVTIHAKKKKESVPDTDSVGYSAVVYEDHIYFPTVP